MGDGMRTMVEKRRNVEHWLFHMDAARHVTWRLLNALRMLILVGRLKNLQEQQ